MQQQRAVDRAAREVLRDHLMQGGELGVAAVDVADGIDAAAGLHGGGGAGEGDGVLHDVGSVMPSSPSRVRLAASRSACDRRPWRRASGRAPPRPRADRRHRTDRTRGRMPPAAHLAAPSTRNRKRALFGAVSSVASQIGCSSASPSAAVPCGSHGSSASHSARSSAATRSASPHSTSARCPAARVRASSCGRALARPVRVRW